MDVTIETAELGLRERKRLVTRRAIQYAALSIAGERGLDAVTVDEIGRRADISPRTFFNYFPTKEAAIVGDGPEIPADADVDAFIAAGTDESIFVGISRLLIGATDRIAEDGELTTLRRALVKANPHLFALRMATMHRFEDQLRALVVERLTADGVVPEAQVETRARLVTLVAMAAMRHAWTCWADAPGSTGLAERLDDSFRELEELFPSKA